MSETKEIWKDVPGYEGLYQVSSLGSVKNKNSNTYKKINVVDGGRLQVTLWKNNEVINFGVHRLVAMSFIGEKPKGYHICHCDGNNKNNRLENLRYDTISQNRIDIYRHGRKSGRGKLEISEVLEIRRLYDSNVTQTEISKMYNISINHAGRIGKRISFYWLNEDGTIDNSKTEVGKA